MIIPLMMIHSHILVVQSTHPPTTYNTNAIISIMRRAVHQNALPGTATDTTTSNPPHRIHSSIQLFLYNWGIYLCALLSAQPVTRLAHTLSRPILLVARHTTTTTQ